MSERFSEVLDHPVAGPLLKLFIYVVALIGATKLFFGATFGTMFIGATVGTLYGLMAVGIVVVWRTNRIINFAAAALGAVPAILMVLLSSSKGVPWVLTFPLAIVFGAAAGYLAERLLIRRFSDAPRLILTVATIGISQFLAYFALKIPIWLGQKTGAIGIVTPFRSYSFTIGTAVFSGDHLFSLVVVAATVAALVGFFRFTRIGIATRAVAENRDRAALLGIPVERVESVAWMVAGAIAALVIFQRVVLVGVPADGSLGLQTLVFALTAAVVARMESIGVAMAAGMGVGVLTSAVLQATGRDSATTAIMLVVILAALLLQRRKGGRAFEDEASSWQSAREFKPIPEQLAHLTSVRGVRWGIGAVVVAVAMLMPAIVGENRIGFAHLIVIQSIVGVSLVVLSGWAGQISLGQWGIAGIAAMVAGGYAANHNGDFFVALFLGVASGTFASVLIGIPALRIRGLTLAVSTLAFAATVQFFVINDTYFIGKAFLPEGANNIDPPCLWERVCLASDLGRVGIPYYYVCLAFLAATVLVAKAYRRNRAGRVVVGVRENTRAASAYGVSPAGTKLGAFAVSGAIASVAGVLLAYQSASVDSSSYGMVDSVYIFLVAAIGGLGSISGVVFATTLIGAIAFFGSRVVDGIDLLVTGPGLLLVLLFLPGGFAEAGHRIRDRYLRTVALKNSIHVPSLLADSAVEEPDSAVLDAGRSVTTKRVDHVTCPVCGEDVALDDVYDHPHLSTVPTEA